jgi:flagellar hook-length control protein FliK
MIDISLMAPAVQAPAPNGSNALASTAKDAAPGAQGFLRLFEIVLDGMPRPVQNPSEELLAGPFVAPADPNALATVATGTTGAVDLASLVAPAASTLPDADSQQIANLLQGLGFEVDAQQIMALGPLDRLQLDQAMEFLQRGLQAGMGTSELLENASFLMPRPWDYQGPDVQSAPRSEGLAVSAPEAEGVDPAQILAATEAVRQMLAASLAGANASPSQPISQVQASAGASPAGQISSVPSDTTTSAGAPDTNPMPMAQAAARTLATDQVSAQTSRPTATQAPSETSPETDSATADATESVFAEAVSRPVRQAPPRHERPAQGQSQPFATPHAQGQDAKPTLASVSNSPRNPSGEAASTASATSETPALKEQATPSGFTLPARVQAPLAESRLATTEGVKPGSMASEFIGRQVLEKVDVHLRQGKRELTVRLWPEELGEVRLSLRMGEADKLDARILVQTEGVRQALLDATPQLREALARHGMEMGRLSVSVDSGRSEAQMAGGERRDPNGRDGGRQTPQRGWREQEMEYAGALALGVDSGIRDGRNTLDMWS